MTAATLNAADLGALLGRSESWVFENWRSEVKAKRLPPPLNGGGKPLTWSRAQVYAMQDAALPPVARLAAQAFRAAEHAALEAAGVSAEQLEHADWRRKLDQRFARS